MAITGPAKFKAYERIGESTYRIRVLVTDPARTPSTFEHWLTVSGTTVPALSADASRQLAALKGHEAIKDLLAGIAVDTDIATDYTPPLPVGPTPDEAWVNNVRWLVRVKEAQAAGLTHATLTTDVASLTTTVNSGYTTARGQKL